MSEAATVEQTDEQGEGIRIVRLRLPAQAEFIALSRLALAGLAEVAMIDDAMLADLKLALTEAVSDAVRRTGDRREGSVEIRYELSCSELGIEVVDDGAGFDPGRLPTVEGDASAGDALGLAIVDAIADELEIDSRAGGQGSRLRFVKRLRHG